MVDPNEELARNLLAAYIAWKMRVGLTYARKNYVDATELESPLGRYWLELASEIRIIMGHVGKPPESQPGSPDTIH